MMIGLDDGEGVVHFVLGVGITIMIKIMIKIMIMIFGDGGSF